MFPEFRELITKLKSNDAYFERLFAKHNELDQEIKNKEENIQLATHTEIEILGSSLAQSCLLSWFKLIFPYWILLG